MQTTARVQAATGEGEDQAVPVVDSMGVGGGVVDRLRELRSPVLAYTGAAKTKARTRDAEYGFLNVRAWAYWHMRELLDPAFGSEVMLPPDDLLISDLTAPTWDVTTGIPPKIRVEPKEDLVDRLGRSPDRGDAVVMAFLGEYMKAAAVHVPTKERTPPSPSVSRYGRQLFGGSSGGGAR